MLGSTPQGRCMEPQTYLSIVSVLLLLSGTPSAQAATIFQQNFDASPLGTYTAARVEADWKGATPYSAYRNNPTGTIIEGSLAHSGRSLRIFYAKGSYSSSGAGWPMSLGSTYKELYASYWVMFQPSFAWVNGGKLPGLCGGACNSGGDVPTGFDGWSARHMWGSEGSLVEYVYHVGQPGQYGHNIGFTDTTLVPGRWYRIDQHIVMNTPGQSNGVLQGWIDGRLAVDINNFRFTETNALGIDIFDFSTFFGGGDSSYAAEKDEYIYFDDFIVSTTPIGSSGDESLD